MDEAGLRRIADALERIAAAEEKRGRDSSDDEDGRKRPRRARSPQRPLPRKQSADVACEWEARAEGPVGATCTLLFLPPQDMVRASAELCRQHGVQTVVLVAPKTSVARAADAAGKAVRVMGLVNTATKPTELGLEAANVRSVRSFIRGRDRATVVLSALHPQIRQAAADALAAAEPPAVSAADAPRHQQGHQAAAQQERPRKPRGRPRRNPAQQVVKHNDGDRDGDGGR
ncbi:MAG TPA: hypothetical protein VKD22_06650 [Ramlibacter sp.]|nr:hypothetical protein [Ramlibacter sp.]